MIQWSQLQKKTKTRWLQRTANGLPKIKTLTLIRRQAMNSRNNTTKTNVTKVAATEWGKSPMYRDECGTLYTEKQILATPKAFAVKGRTPEQLEAQAKKAKARKNSHKSSYAPSNKKLGSTVLGESAYTGQARTQYTAMAELVTRANEVAL